jgi:hypothetical protein
MDKNWGCDLGGRVRNLRHSYLCSAHAAFAAPVLLNFGLAGPAVAQQQAVPVGGIENLVKPLHRFDVHLEYQSQNAGVEVWTTTLRYQRPYDLIDSWKVTVRADMPFPINNDNPARDFRGGAGDLLVQATLSRSFEGDNGFGFALRMIVPTASADEFGGGRWRLLPTVGYQVGLPGISPSSFFQPVLRYQFDFAGDPLRRHFSDLQFAPTLNIALPKEWYVALFPSTDIRYNFMNREWFVPLNIEVGRQWSTNLVTSLELGVPIYRELNPVYLFKVDGRLTLLF